MTSTNAASHSSSHSHTQQLPTPRHLLTSIFNTLFAPLPTAAENDADSNSTSVDPSKPVKSEHESTTVGASSHILRSLSPNQKSLLTTLHVLFPPPTLLQAFDLLDRRLVTRIVLDDDEDEDGSQLGGADGYANHPQSEGILQDAPPPQERVSIPANTNPSPALKIAPASQILDPAQELKPLSTAGRRNGMTTIMHQVRSSTIPSQHPHRGRYRDASSTTLSSAERVYTVCLASWNCNCAAFAFSAFPYRASSPADVAPWKALFVGEEEEEEEEEEEDGGEKDEKHEDEDGGNLNPNRASSKRDSVSSRMRRDYNDPRLREDEDGADGQLDLTKEWEFGGLSFDGRRPGGVEEEGVPVCKHLLAALMGERWDVLKSCVIVRRVHGESGQNEIAGLGAG